MKKVITVDAKITCKHITGVALLLYSQDWVTINGRPILVDNDPETKIITGCANVGPTIKPCSLTLKATTGYSNWIRVDGRRICLDTISGLTDGTPPGTVKYEVRNPAQHFVREV